MTIFISIASYRDPLLQTTVVDAYRNASNPGNLVFGIVDQSDKDETFRLNELPFRQQVRYLRVDPIYARGACWARSAAQSLWSNEDYYFQIDSHTLFEPGWDTHLIENYKMLAQYHTKPVITAYPHAFEVVNNDITNLKRTKFSGMLTLVAGDAFVGPTEMYVHTTASILGYSTPVHGYLISGNYLFTSGTIVEQVPYDPFLFFSGEEHSLALRLWTHGYNIFHVPNVPIYTHYGRDYRTTMWSDKLEAQRPIKWWQLDMRSKSRLADVVTGKDVGKYGLGTDRTLADYIRLTGIDYLNRTTEARAKNGQHVFNQDYRLPLNF